MFIRLTELDTFTTVYVNSDKIKYFALHESDNYTSIEFINNTMLKVLEIPSIIESEIRISKN